MAALPPAQLQQQQEPSVNHVKAAYATELHELKNDLQQLKGAFFNRQFARSKYVDGSQALQALGPIINWDHQGQVAALAELQCIVAAELLDPACTLPVAADAVHKKILAGGQASAYRAAMSALHQPCLSRLVGMYTEGGCLDSRMLDLNGNMVLIIHALNREQLAGAAGVRDPLSEVQPEQRQLQLEQPGGVAKRPRTSSSGDLVGDLLNMKSTKERELVEKGEEVMALLDRKTALQQAKLEEFHMGGAAVQEPCKYVTKQACMQANGTGMPCNKLHKRKVLQPWTDESLGNCNFVDSCNNMHKCRYVHWEDDPNDDQFAAGTQQMQLGAGNRKVPKYLQALQEPQWINCDIRTFKWEILGKFGVIMTDPPWRIHQDLPYGTMSDDELRRMNLGMLQDDGVIFMWVTGRALELGRELLFTWGYKRVDELIWVKTNSLRRLIITGRTGHWLNHSKEHCLVGYKGNPQINRFVDADVLVSEVRETSRKPDEMYPLLERLSPGTRKLEVFARQHNVRPGWVSLGNQLDGSHLTDPEMLERYRHVYGEPEGPKNAPRGRAKW